ncbi:hypothetical protein GN277_07125 [Lachnospiraceae bacterium WCA-9-b2]|uniref:Tail spike domain-containing protein n=1 Tax=Sporofaciens musculi TaxID=2681861 RepID=A0A7X3SI82_9FIRM|nr:phage tail protein [Sporofaciens musculi]MXP75162.1 hypothetical protein [Sporofaciens musculi]
MQRGELTFSLPPMHKGIDLIRKLSSVVQVYDGGELLYEGRVLDSKSDMYHTVTYTCEGSLAYLLDSIQHPKAYHNLTPASYLNDKLIQHNSQVGAEKRFLLGTVEKQTMNYDAREDNQYTNTLDTIMDKLVDSNGGYLRVRKQGDDRYLDYLESYHRTSGQVIRFGENILDLTEHISAENVITVLIPLGKAAEGENREGGKRLTIESVNGGKDYLEDLEAVALYGRIVGTKNWDDVTVPANLKTKGQEYLAGARNLTATIELTAIDLHLVDVDIDRIRLGDMIRVVSPPHKLDKYMMVSKREYNLVNPQEDKIVLGDTIAALTEKQVALQKNMEKQKHFSASVEEVRGSVSILAGEVDSAKQDVSALGGKVQTLEGNSSDVQKTLQGIHNSLTAQEEKIKGMREDIHEDRDRFNALERADQQAAETTQGILDRLGTLEGAKQNLEERIQGILTRLEALEGGA